MNKTNILKIYESSQTVFTLKDIALILKETNLNTLKSNLNYYIKTGKLISLHRGIYAKNKDYNKLELATKIYTPSYISFETMLYAEGLIFQYYDAFYAASYLSRKLVIDNIQYVFRKIKNEILTNQKGLIVNNNYYSAAKERAFLDMLYLYKDYYFDNLKSLDWELCFEILPIYKNSRLSKTVNRLYKETKND